MIGKTEFQFKGQMVRIEVDIDDMGIDYLDDDGKFTDTEDEWQIDINQGVLVGDSLPEPEEPEYQEDFTDTQEKAWEVTHDTWEKAYEEWGDMPYENLADVATPLRHGGSRCCPYWRPELSNYAGVGLDDKIKYICQDWARIVGYNDDDWCYTYFMVEIAGYREYSIGIESDGGEDYHTEVVANLAAELTDDPDLIAEIQDRFIDDIYNR